MIINAIVKQLNIYFQDCNIYVDEIKQGFPKEPCFFIKQIASSRVKELHKTYKSYNDFVIHYFLSEDEQDINEKYNIVGDMLYQILEYIDADSKKIHGMDMRFEVNDKVLYFYVSYNYYLKLITSNADKMEDMDIEGGFKDV